MIKNLYKSLIPSIIILLTLTGCGEQLCSYCGQEKICKEYDILGTSRYICNDCMNNPEASSSGNVIWDYASSLVDPEKYVPSGNSIEESDIEVSDNTETDNFVPENIADTVVDSISDVVDDKQIFADTSNSDSSQTINDTDNQSDSNTEVNNPAHENTEPMTQSASSSDTKERLSQLIEKNGFSLIKDEESNNVFRVQKNNNDQKINIEFKNDDADKMIITMDSDGDQNIFEQMCINSSLAYINDNDYETMGKEIYNNAYQYGNYNFDKYSFYYILSSKKELEDGLPPVRFEIITHH